MGQGFDFRQYWDMLRRRWRIIVILPLIATLTSGLFSFYFIPPVFKTSTTLIVGKKAVDYGQAIGEILDYSVLMANQQLAKTYAAIAKSYTVEQNVIKALNLPFSVSELDNMISVRTINETEILEISVINSDPLFAASIANTVAQEFSKAVIEIKKVDSVSIIDRAMTPINPIKPDINFNVLLSMAIGLLASLGLILFLDYLEKTTKSASEKSKEIEKLLGMPVLGIIPDYKVLKKG